MPEYVQSRIECSAAGRIPYPPSPRLLLRAQPMYLAQLFKLQVTDSLFQNHSVHFIGYISPTFAFLYLSVRLSFQTMREPKSMSYSTSRATIPTLPSIETRSNPLLM